MAAAPSAHAAGPSVLAVPSSLQDELYKDLQETVSAGDHLCRTLKDLSSDSYTEVMGLAGNVPVCAASRLALARDQDRILERCAGMQLPQRLSCGTNNDDPSNFTLQVELC